MRAFATPTVPLGCARSIPRDPFPFGPGDVPDNTLRRGWKVPRQGCRHPAPNSHRVESILFVDVPGPGALARFVERRGDPESGSDALLLSDALGPSPLRAMFGSKALMAPWYAVFEEAFGPSVRVFERDAERWRGGTLRAGIIAVDREGTFPLRAWWTRLPGWPAPPCPLESAVAASGMPRERMRPISRIVELGTVDLLDQRRLLVETVPVRYRIPIALRPKVQ